MNLEKQISLLKNSVELLKFVFIKKLKTIPLLPDTMQ